MALKIFGASFAALACILSVDGACLHMESSDTLEELLKISDIDSNKSTATASYESLSSDFEMSDLDCQHGHFLFPTNVEARDIQGWIAGEVNSWLEAAAADPEIAARPEGKAAVAVLETIGVDVNVLKNYFAGKLFKSAVFTRSDDGQLTMQAAALVQQVGNEVSVHGIASRRSFLHDAAAVPGAGKALLAAILESQHREDLEKTIALVGSPGDDFVDRLYRKHGMKHVGETLDGSIKLQMNITADCVDFVRDAILCGKRGIADNAKILWSLVPYAEQMFRTCAHIVPAETYKEQISKMLGRSGH